MIVPNIELIMKRTTKTNTDEIRVEHHGCNHIIGENVSFMII